MLSFCLSFCPQDPTDGSESWGGGPMLWANLEGSEIEQAADLAEREGRLDEVRRLERINERVEAVTALFSQINKEVEDGFSSTG